MSKYEPLAEFLTQQKSEVISLSFSDVEKKLGFPLPKSAYTHRAWWSNNPDNSVMTRVWINAGFRTQEVDMDAQKVVFLKTAPTQPSGMRESPRSFVAEHHPLRGALKGTIRIVVDVDLTKPADPDWGQS